IKPDLLLLAEASAREPWYFTNGFDAAYDWTYEPGRWSLENVFDEPNQTVPRLREALTNSGRGFDQDALVFRFLNNNDTGQRFITRHGRAMEMVAAAMLLTLP
ncbi:MAG: alpha-amylase, partial [Gemmatimonadales bacterium]|nr:alpha-amylase [Gemmatimonadales bacterium]